MISLLILIHSDIRMDEVTQAVENLKKEWSQAVSQLEESIAAIESCGKTGKGTEEATSLPRLNGSAQDALQLLKSLQFRLDLLAQQLPTFDEVQSGQATLGSWDEQYKKYDSVGFFFNFFLLLACLFFFAKKLIVFAGCVLA
jgi:hypothetical protein